jgi:hypothetical protein
MELKATDLRRQRKARRPPSTGESKNRRTLIIQAALAFIDVVISITCYKIDPLVAHKVGRTAPTLGRLTATAVQSSENYGLKQRMIRDR